MRQGDAPLVCEIGKSEFEEQKAPLLKGAVSLKADWRIHPN
jgi:hypothetical protein